MPTHITYESMENVFIQDRPDHVPSAEQIPERFGLVANDWPDVAKMNSSAGPNVKYKLLFIARHGEGVHNAASRKFGKEVHHWAYLEGDEELKWGPDPELVELGAQQARMAHEAWRKYSPPEPQTLYSSPLRRALQTCSITFPGGRRSCSRCDIRELVTGFSCDYRLPNSTVASVYPQHDFSRIFSENDPYAGLRETHEQLHERVKKVVDGIFESDDSHVISITAHGDWMKTASGILGRKKYRIPTGGAVAFLIKATFTN
ncbi:phosphoglycerate mutase-like protein [Auriculariales sp. MPI-PUGE-AT-0066]|nr:phosphoglycerate mutase-like protein [Auriculariales sp. MPI-PUGE-AT-0066]